MNPSDLEKLVEAARKKINEAADKWEKTVFTHAWDDDTTTGMLIEDFRDFLDDSI